MTWVYLKMGGVILRINILKMEAGHLKMPASQDGRAGILRCWHLEMGDFAKTCKMPKFKALDNRDRPQG